MLGSARAPVKRSGDPGQVVLHSTGPTDFSMSAMMQAYFIGNNVYPPSFPNFVLLDRDGIVRFHVPAGTDLSTYPINDFSPFLDVIDPAFGNVDIAADPPSASTKPFSDSVTLQSLVVSLALPATVEKRVVSILYQVQAAMANRHFGKAAAKATAAADALRVAGADSGIRRLADSVAVTLAGYPAE